MGQSTEDLVLAFGLTLAAGLATTIGAALSFCIPVTYIEILPISLAFSAGVMIYVSFIEITQKGLDAFETELIKTHGEDTAKLLSHLYLSISFFCGIIIGYIIDFIVHLLGYEHDIDIPQEIKARNITKNDTDVKPSSSFMKLLPNKQRLDEDNNNSEDITLQEAEIPSVPSHSTNNEEVNESTVENESETNEEKENEKERKALIKMSLITGVAIGIHNFPEGLATFVSTLAGPTLGVSIAVAIAIHNIPEGICVAMPIFFATGSKYKAFFWAFLSGIFEPIGALIGYAIIDSMFNDVVFGVLFGFVAGIMIYISFKAILPTARRKDKNDKFTSYLVFTGFLVMDVSLILFKLA
eukprot:UN01445